jgi:asparagine synthase (glutamine-hydrolysing)
MCGIAGKFGGSIDLVLQATHKLTHRGPDDWGIFVDEKFSIALGHRRLSILDPSSAGHQPMIITGDDVVIVFNGEIYNFRELKFELETRGYSFVGGSDTEVLLQLYMCYGEDLVNKLNGIFAFSIWDTRKQSLFLARDSFGVKPLYYCAQQREFAFASELKALLDLMPISRVIDAESIDRYLSYLWCPGAGTPLKDVYKLEPGEALLVKSGEIIKKWSWYRPIPSTEVVTNFNEGTAINETATQLRGAVHRQMISDVPVGAFLSGGVDSTSVVAFAREINPEIQCFTIDVGGSQDHGVENDLPYAIRAAKHLNTSLEIVKVDSKSMAQNFANMISQLDEPLADPAALNVFYISQAARDAGIKVLLSGAGGDDIFTGYRRHYAQRLEKYWDWLPSGVVRATADWLSLLNQKQALVRRISKAISVAGLNGDRRIASYFRWNSESTLSSLYSSDLKHESENFDAALPMLHYLTKFPSDLSPLVKMLLLEQRFFLVDHNLNYTDKMSMAAGVEVRVPFLDKELVDFATKLPLKVKQSRSEGKWILKKAMEPYIPMDSIYRSKAGFGAPVRNWITGDLREMVRDILSPISIQSRGIFDPLAVTKLISDNEAGRIDGAYTILALLSVEIWFRSYIDN